MEKIQNFCHFLQFFAYKMENKGNFQNLKTRFVELPMGKVHAKYQVPDMYAVQM